MRRRRRGRAKELFANAGTLLQERGAASEGIHSGGLAFALEELEKHLGELHEAVHALPR